MVPVPKSISTTDITNHRPIALAPVPAKIFEAVIHVQLSGQVEKYMLNSQRGFRPVRGVNTNMACFNQILAEYLDEGMQVDTVCTNFQKAFDKVNHRLILKLKYLGFTDAMVQFIESYLSERIQYAVYRNVELYCFRCPSGVPQGLNLGPLFFLLFINDIDQGIKHSHLLLYADDLKIFRKI